MAIAYQAMDDQEERISALERAITDGDHDLSELNEAGEFAARLTALEEQVADIADSIAELEAASQAIRGYVGNIRATNRDVEQRVDAALAERESAVERESPTTDSNRAPDAFKNNEQIHEEHSGSHTDAPASERTLADGHGKHSATHCPTCGQTSGKPSPAIPEQSTGGSTNSHVTQSEAQSESTPPSSANSCGQEALAGHSTEPVSPSRGEKGRTPENQQRNIGSRTIGRSGGDARDVLDSVMNAPAEADEGQSSTGPLDQLRNML